MRRLAMWASGGSPKLSRKTRKKCPTLSRATRARSLTRIVEPRFVAMYAVTILFCQGARPPRIQAVAWTGRPSPVTRRSSTARCRQAFAASAITVQRRGRSRDELRQLFAAQAISRRVSYRDDGRVTIRLAYHWMLSLNTGLERFLTPDRRSACAEPIPTPPKQCGECVELHARRPPQMVQWRPQSLVNSGAPTFGGSTTILFVLGFEMFSTKKPSIDRPCPRPDHCGSATERSQDD